MITKEGTSSQSKVSSFKSIRLASDPAQGHFLRLEIIKMFPFKKIIYFSLLPSNVALQLPRGTTIQKVAIRYSESRGRFELVQLSRLIDSTFLSDDLSHNEHGK